MSAATLDLSTPQALSFVALWGCRVGGLLLIAPVFAARTIPMPLRAAVLVLLTVTLLPAARAGLGQAPSVTPATLLSETLIGFAIGLGAAVLIGAMEVAGEILAIQIGLSGAGALDPLTQVPTTALGQFAQLFAIALLLSMDGHLLLLDAVAASAELLPVGGGIAAEAGLGAMVALGGSLFALGLRFAAPVVAALLIANAAIGVLAKAAPQVSILMVAFPVQIGIGIFALAASVPLIATFFASWPSVYDGVVTTLLTALTVR